MFSIILISITIHQSTAQPVQHFVRWKVEEALIKVSSEMEWQRGRVAEEE